MSALTIEALGLPWHLRTWGGPGAPPILLLHGFTGSAAFWAPVAEALAGAWRVLAPDLPGHGATPAPGAGWSLNMAADALALLLAAAGGQGATVVGYSLGGRLALHLAHRHPRLLARLVLIGASAGLPSEPERAARREADERWAELLRQEGLEAFLAEWEAQPLFASQRTLAPEQRAWLRGLRAGQDACALAASLEAFGLGAQEPLHEALSDLHLPTWLVVGAEDAKFSALAEAMAARLPDARVVPVPGAGHNVPLERPQALIALIDALSPLPR